MIFNCKEMISQLIVPIKDKAKEKNGKLPPWGAERVFSPFIGLKSTFHLDFSLFRDRLNPMSAKE